MKIVTRRTSRPDRHRTFQPRVPGGRLGLPGAVEQRIWERVDADAQKFNVSRSFIVSIALAEHLGIEIQTWDDVREARKARERERQRALKARAS